MISIICPFYNEEESAVNFFHELITVISKLEDRFEIICINDGSIDGTLKRLLKQQTLSPENVTIRILDLSRNFGKEAALTAGFDYAQGDAVIPIDTDLQDPPELIEQMLTKWKEGFDIVLAKRSNRKSDSWLKRNTAQMFYKVHNRISTTPIPEGVGDFRLLNRAAVNALKQLPERQRFMKGLFNWVGFHSTQIEYARPMRENGNSKFTFWKLWNFALDGLTSFSTVPLKTWSYLGLAISLVSFIYGSFIIIRTLIFGIDLPGYASLIVTVLFLGGLQLIGIGVLGEYIGRIYLESKQRPIYIIKKVYE